jgi:DNA-binding response OmpR family regulator
MFEIVLATNDSDRFGSFVRGLSAEPDWTIATVRSVEEVRRRASSAPPGLMVIDETVDGVSNIDIARDVILANAMINLVLVSSLSAEDFHEVSEGLGVLASLPPCPEQEDASRLIGVMKSLRLGSNSNALGY